MKRTIDELMAVSDTDRDTDWLLDSLQSAVELEFATIPVYLSGLWSVKDQQNEVADLIKGVVLEEMLHMGLACNMLRGIGGSPQVVAPTYPGQLPGGVRPDLTVYLAGLTSETAAMYMQIELPENPLARAAEDDEFPTIGAFYDAIAAAFTAVAPAMSKDGQLSASFSVPDPGRVEEASLAESFGPLGSVADVLEGITTIKDQGEGTSTSPNAPEFGGEIAHYYRFGEIYHGRKLVKGPNGFEWTGDPVPFPDCFPVARVPAGGYPQVAGTAEFDGAFATLVSQLESAWGTGGSSALGSAIGTMFSLQSLAQTLIATPIPGGTGNYGPDFIPANA